MNSNTIDLTPSRWARVDRLFEQAVELPDADRERFLRTECSDDTELCDYILSLLQIDGGGYDLEKTVVDALQTAISDVVQRQDQMEGAELGPYRIVRTVGSGGMGVVYLAERADEQYEQQVAIKLGRHRLVDQQAEQRLRGERQILANLDHPNIARLLDGGAADDGTPYIVMEYIDGVRIDTYCDRHRLSIDARLELFQSICAAVHYAHQNLVVHRDIKPSNILVTDDGVPKLLDFGIAKLIDGEGTAAPGVTRDGAVVMTPENAAPEQVLNRPITTATDTYALGALLYSLLCGMPPYELEGKTPTEMARIICQKQPPAPSARIASAIAEARRGSDPGASALAERIGANRGTTTERVVKRLRGDLDVIALSALRKEPERRYRSVNQFGEDVRLHRVSQPIQARADSWRYRAGKFVRRHTAGVITASLIVVLLAGFGVAMSIQNQRIAAERDVAQQVSGFLEDIFRSPDPERARGDDVTAKEILDAGAARIDDQLHAAPEIQAALMGTIGRVYFNLGAYEPSARMLTESLALRETHLGEEHADTVASRLDLGRVLTHTADSNRARNLLTSALEQSRRVFGEESPETAEAMSYLAELHIAATELESAAELALASVAIYRRYESDRATDFANATNLVGLIRARQGDLDAAEQLQREAIEIVERNEGPDHPYMAYYLQNLGVLQRSMGDLDAAEESLDRAIEATRRILGERHDHLAGTLVIKGMLLHGKGDLFAAEEALRDALDIHREAMGPEHPFVGYDLTSLGMLLHDRGDLAGAEDALREALRIYSASIGDEHQYVGSALTELGAVLNSSGRSTEALPILSRAVEIRERDYSSNDRIFAATRVEYGVTLAKLERFAEAQALLESSYEILMSLDDRRSRRARRALEDLYAAMGRPELAAALEELAQP